MPPAAGFLSRRLPYATTGAAFGADSAALGSSGRVKKGVWVLDYRASPLLARQGLWSSIEGKEAERVGERGRGCRVRGAEVCTRKQETGDPPGRLGGAAPGRRGRGCGDATVMTKQVMPSIEKEVRWKERFLARGRRDHEFHPDNHDTSRIESRIFLRRRDLSSFSASTR